MRRLPYSRVTVVQIAVSALFTAGGAFALIREGALLWPTLFFGACTAIFVLSPLLGRRPGVAAERRGEAVEFDDAAIRRRLANGTLESITWDDLHAIDIVTTDAGPFADDVYWLFTTRDRSRGCAISSAADGFKPLLAKIQTLPGFDNTAVIR